MQEFATLSFVSPNWRWPPAGCQFWAWRMADGKWW